MSEPDVLERITSELRAFVRERDWEQFHDPKNLAMAVASEAGELAAELCWVKNDEADAWCAVAANRRRVADEVADVAITLLLFSDRVGLDLPAAIRSKLERNRERYPAEEVRGLPGLPDGSG